MSSLVAACGAAIVLLLDASSSISDHGWRLQLEGHRAALSAPALVSKLEAEPIAVRAFGFAGFVGELVPWTILRNGDDARAFGNALLADTDRDFRYGHGTYTGDAVRRAIAAHAEVPCDASRRIIDVVTDGPPNGGVPAETARDEAEAADITINVLTVQSHADADPAITAREMIATSGGFVLETENWRTVVHAITRKIAMELAAR